ncbi:MAG: DUF1232 domain-containing protein [Chloroflexota bacterium]|nr:DUF1232 domain-containing protein [Chloroflexota bacterium]
MNQNQQGELVSQQEADTLTAWLQGVVRQARLAWRLFWDRRVPVWAKLIPPAALAYVLSPVDFIPAAIVPGLGQLDDIAVLLIGIKLFVELAPPEVVREHLLALGARIKGWRVVEGEDGPSVVIEGDYEIRETETAKET